MLQVIQLLLLSSFGASHYVFLHEDACATESVAKLWSEFDRLQRCSKVVRSSENEIDRPIEHD